MKVINWMLMVVLIFLMGLQGIGLIGLGGYFALIYEVNPWYTWGESVLGGAYMVILGSVCLAAARGGLRIQFSI